MSDMFSIRISGPLRRALRRISKRQNRAESDLAREAIRRYVAIEEFRRLRDRTLPLAEAQGIVTDDDVFRLIS